MHILFLTDNFPPEVNAPASRTFEHTREWVLAGHRVTVITCAPNFPKGRVFNGYKNKLWQSEVIDGVRVIRVWTYITANEGFYKRTLDYVSFGIASSIAALGVRGVDVIVGTSPQFFTALGAFFTGLMKRRPWVFELRDIWPESIKAVGAIKAGPLLSMIEVMEMFLYRRATRIIAVTHSFKRILGQRGVDADKIDVITNGADLTQFAPRSKPTELTTQLGLQGRFVVGYVGTHGLAHGLDTLLEAGEILSRSPDTAADIHILLLGDGAQKNALVSRAASMALKNVTFIDTVPKNEVSNYWALLDASIIHLKRDPLFTTVIPSKLFECMAMGLPVLHGVEGESADIVRREAVGETFEPQNAAQLANAILRLRQNPDLIASYRQNACAAAPRYDRRHLAGAMLQVLEKTARTRAGADLSLRPTSTEPV